MKASNERKIDITPLREHALLLRGKIYEVQVKLVEEVFKIKQVESRLEEISIIAAEFRDKTHDLVETIHGLMT